MGFSWQDLVVWAAILAAVLFLVRRFMRFGGSNKPSGCGTCSGCAAGQTDHPLVAIQLPRSQRDS